MPGAPGVVVERACLPRVTFAGTQTVHSRPQVVHAPQDQVIRLQGGDTVIPYDVSLPPRVFDVHPGGITVTTEHNVVIQPRVTVPADEINIHPVQIRDERGGVTVAEATVELACEEGGGKPQPIVGKPAIAPHKGGMAPAHPGAIVGGAASSSSQDEPV
ncbi:MAG TPA: hypothetical protein VFH51_13115 [Myxococcota bacterium]|nr:hypothetical protein [Myxococcota bacterium]